MTQRYNIQHTIDALKILGFNVRNPDGGTTIFCKHTITKEEIWIPNKTNDGFLEDVLTSIFKPIGLKIVYFKSVYINLPKNNTPPSDQY